MINTNDTALAMHTPQYVVQTLNSQQFGEIRIVILDGEPWFVAKDVCDALEIVNARDAINRLDDDEKNTVALTDGNRGNPNVNIISEPGVYSLMGSSRKAEAKAFRRWVNHEVIPSIRKYGVYATNNFIEQAIANPEYGIRMLTALKDEREQRKKVEQERDALALKVEQDAPKVLVADALTASPDTTLMRDLSKFLTQNGLPNMGEHRLYQRLVDEGYLLRSKRTKDYTPTQRAADLKLFETERRPVAFHRDGTPIIRNTVRPNGKGWRYFIQKYLGESYEQIVARLNPCDVTTNLPESLWNSNFSRPV